MLSMHHPARPHQERHDKEGNMRGSRHSAKALVIVFALFPFFLPACGSGDSAPDGESHNVLLRRSGPAANRGEIYSAIRGPWKYLYYPRMGRGELFHLPTDPREGVDLAAQNPEIAAELHQTLANLGIMSPLRGAPAEMPAERLEQLRALGYVD